MVRILFGWLLMMIGETNTTMSWFTNCVCLYFLPYNAKVAADQEALKPFLFNLISVQNIHPFLGTSEILSEQKEGVGKFLLYSVYLSITLWDCPIYTACIVTTRRMVDLDVVARTKLSSYLSIIS